MLIIKEVIIPFSNTPSLDKARMFFSFSIISTNYFCTHTLNGSCRAGTIPSTLYYLSPYNSIVRSVCTETVNRRYVTFLACFSVV